MKNIPYGDLAWGGGIIVLALAATVARQLHYIDEDTTTRIVLGATGLMVAWYGNRMPKAFLPSACARKVARVGGWSMAISGLVYAGVWAFAPFDIALVVGCGAIIAGIVVTIGYGRVLRGRERTA
ncbi:ammonium transporter [Sphingomonas arenae]|uniref:ammonium transporter n=1 Tax=Sphingomonas arenae TaxID=2812555 RepID=UPI001967894D|nr:ammonium transporter [Sphingomonas arenae]